MTISSTANRNTYTGNDTTANYSYTYRIFLETDLTVTVRNTSTDVETALVLNTDYSVAGVGDAGGGSITLLGSGKAWQGTGANLNTGYSLVIRRVVGLTQGTDIRNQGDFFPEVHEDFFDKAIMIDQQQQDSIDRSVKLSETIDPSTFDTEIPPSVVGASNLSLVINETGDGFAVGPTVADISGAEAAAAAAAASAIEAEQNVLDVFATETISASGTISHNDNARQHRRVEGNGGPVTASATPFGTTPTNFVDGMQITLVGISDTNTVRIDFNDASYGALINGSVNLGRGQTITLIYDATLVRFIERCRSN